MLFMIQRIEVHVFSRHDETDQEFGGVLRRADTERGEVYAYCSEFVGGKIVLIGKVKVDLKR